MVIDRQIPDVLGELPSQAPAKSAEKRHRSDASDLSVASAGAMSAQGGTSDAGGASNAPTVTLNPIDLQKAVEKINDLVKSQQRDVSFSVDHEAYATVIKVFKSETGELIKQFPPEEILAMIARMRKNIGWLVDSKA